MVNLFLRTEVLNKKKTVENYFYFQEENELYVKNSTKKYNNIEEVVEDLMVNGLLCEISEFTGLGKELESNGFILFYTQLLKYLDRNSEYLSNDVNIFKLLTINQVCEFLNVTRPSVYKLLNDGHLEYVKVLGHKRVQLMELLNFIQEKRSK